MSKQIIPAIVILIILAALGLYADTVAHQELTMGIRVILYTLIVSLALALGGVSLFSVLMFREVLLRQIARRKIVQREADVYAIVSEQHGVFIRDKDKTASWKPAHLIPNQYQNGKPTPATEIELTTWGTWQGLHSKRAAAAQVISSPTLALPSPQVDLLSALDTVQRCLIVGASDTGKTTLLQHVISRRVISSKVIVIDPHSYPGKWGGIVIGTGRNYTEIGKALDGLVRLMTKRYDDIGRGAVAEMGHNRLTIIIDEWRAIVYNVKGAADCIKTLLTESRKAAFSVFVATHSERVKALGLDGEGDLKDGFAVVRLTIAGGIRQATIDTGTGETPATLPGLFYRQAVKVVEPDEIFNLENEPDETEARIVHLHGQGETVSNIAALVYGSKGGPQNRKVQAVLEKYGKV